MGLFGNLRKTLKLGILPRKSAFLMTCGKMGRTAFKFYESPALPLSYLAMLSARNVTIRALICQYSERQGLARAGCLFVALQKINNDVSDFNLLDACRVSGSADLTFQPQSQLALLIGGVEAADCKQMFAFCT